MYKLVTELDGTVIHVGSDSECRLILKAFETYGIRSDKFVILPA